MTKQDADDYIDWFHLELELQKAIQMLNDQNYGLLKGQLDALSLIAKGNYAKQMKPNS